MTQRKYGRATYALGHADPVALNGLHEYLAAGLLAAVSPRAAARLLVHPSLAKSGG